MNDSKIAVEIEANIRALKDYKSKSSDGLVSFGDWEKRFQDETRRILDSDSKLNLQNLQNFRGMQIFVSDIPTLKMGLRFDCNSFIFKMVVMASKILGCFRGEDAIIADQLSTLEKSNGLDLLKKYPCPQVGNPVMVSKNRLRYTGRYLRHLYFLNLFNIKLKNKFKTNFNVMDIGCSYGIFSSLLKREMPLSHHVLVDGYGQLILAHYFLAKTFPEARIAGFKELIVAGEINREFIDRYDFVLCPTDLYDLISSNSIDLVTNFISFAEMSREWFDKYITSTAFKTAKFLFTVNRYDSYPTYKNNLTILDYPLHEYTKLHMRNSIFFKFAVRPIYLFFYKKEQYSSSTFEFIGQR